LCSSPNIVAYLLKTKTVERKKQPLLFNDRVLIKYIIAVFRQRLGKHVLAVTDTDATIEVQCETVFYSRSVQGSYTKDNWPKRVSTVRECVRKRVRRE
jgi:hypothetical protein